MAIRLDDFSDIKVASLKLNGGIGVNSTYQGMTENHVCLNEAIPGFDANGGFTWETSTNAYKIRSVDGNSATVNTVLYFGIPIN